MLAIPLSSGYRRLALISKLDVTRFIEFSRTFTYSYQRALSEFMSYEIDNVSTKDFLQDIQRYFNISTTDRNILYNVIMTEIFYSLQQKPIHRQRQD